MTKRKSDLEITPDETAQTTPAAPVVALVDQLDTARRALYAVAKSGATDELVPDVLARCLSGSADVLLVTWRAWDIYAVPDQEGWIIRADMVR